jgi:hypothetical protein
MGAPCINVFYMNSIECAYGRKYIFLIFKNKIKLQLQICNHIVNDFGMHREIGQLVRSYIITRHKMLVKL